MEQYLLAKDTIALLTKEAFPDDKKKQKLIKGLIEEYGIFIGDIEDPQKVVTLLNYCAKFLQDRGIYVYYDIETKDGQVSCITFAVGEVGRLLKELDEKVYAFNLLLDFIAKCRPNLPSKCVSLESKMVSCRRDIVWFVIYWLSFAYKSKSKRELKRACKEGWKLAHQANRYLEKFKDWQKYAGLTLL